MSVSRIHLESIFSLWINNLLNDFTMNSLSVSRNHCEFTINFKKSLWINISFVNSLFIAISLEINHFFREFTFYFASFLCIYNPTQDFSLNSLFASLTHSVFLRIHLESPILFANDESNITMNPLLISRFHYLFSMNTLLISGFQTTIFFPKSLWIYYLIPEIN